MTLARGDAAAALAKAPRRLKGRMAVGGQEHFYLESQIALAIPGEDDEVRVISSTQHPSEIQTMVAGALGVPANAVTTEVRRMGGAFGGKETQGNKSEEHTSELQSLMRISYAVFCLQKKKNKVTSVDTIPCKYRSDH